jgi:plasmid stabilization system protein ParE
MAFQVKITPKAERDLDAILTRLLNEGAGEQGWRWFVGLRKAIATLDEFPARCPKAPEDAAAREEVRQLLYGNKPHVYRVLFKIQNDLVVVIHVRRPKQNTLSLH